MYQTIEEFYMAVKGFPQTAKEDERLIKLIPNYFNVTTIRQQECWASTLAFCAACRGPHLMKKLLHIGGTGDQNDNAFYALRTAFLYRNAWILPYLIGEFGKNNIDRVDGDGQTILHQFITAIRKDHNEGKDPHIGNETVFEMLLREAKANPNSVGKTGRTALMRTIEYDLKWATDLLLQHGAKTFPCDPNGKSTLDYARDCGDADILKTVEWYHQKQMDDLVNTLTGVTVKNVPKIKF